MILPNIRSEKTKEQDNHETTKYANINDPSLNSLNKENLKYLQAEGVSWENLNLEPELCLQLKTLGFKRPSNIQSKVLKTFRKMRRLFVQSQNGSGKTLAFSIPAISIARAAEADHSLSASAPQVLIMADTNVLVLQLKSILDRLTQNYKPLVVDAAQKKVPLNPTAHILISTPISLLNNLNRKKISLERVSMVIVDEADSALSSDRAKNFFIKLMKKDLAFQNPFMILSSATTTKNLTDILDKLQEDQNLLRIEKEREELTLKNVQQFFVEYSDRGHKLHCLMSVINGVEAQNILIFDNSKKHLIDLHQQLTQAGQKTALVMSGNANVDPAQNQMMIKDFVAGKYRILLTTNLLARGIDMRKVTLVINYSLPILFDYNQIQARSSDPNEKQVDLETYLHRVGRTGRFGDFGIALNFVHPRGIRHIEDIRKHYGAEIREIRTDSLEGLKGELSRIKQMNMQKRQFLEENI